MISDGDILHIDRAFKPRPRSFELIGPITLIQTSLIFVLKQFYVIIFLEIGTAMSPASSLSRCENSTLQLLRKNSNDMMMKQMKSLKMEALNLKMKCRVLAIKALSLIKRV